MESIEVRLDEIINHIEDGNTNRVVAIHLRPEHMQKLEKYFAVAGQHRYYRGISVQPAVRKSYIVIDVEH